MKSIALSGMLQSISYRFFYPKRRQIDMVWFTGLIVTVIVMVSCYRDYNDSFILQTLFKEIYFSDYC